MDKQIEDVLQFIEDQIIYANEKEYLVAEFKEIYGQRGLGIIGENTISLFRRINLKLNNNETITTNKQDK